MYIFKGYYMSMKILHLLNTYNGATKFGKVKGTTWPYKLKYILGSVLSKIFKIIVLTNNTIIAC